jgi:cytochrome c oxidase assembly protein Cox11
MRTENRKQRTESRQKRIYLILICVLSSVFCLLIAYAAGAEKSQQFQFSKNQEIQQVKPKKPVRIKLHRNAKGDYSWDLTGDNVDEVIQADRRLRKLLKIE